RAGEFGHPADASSGKEQATSAGEAEVEVRTQQYPVTVVELSGDQRDRVHAEQARRDPGFAEYEQKTAGSRTIPVLALRRR
ncbi:MAG: hypothetical protein ACJ71Y_00565, partial [Blastococcus sp.]